MSDFDRKRKKYYLLLICIGLALATTAAFEQVRNNEFVHLDDPTYITHNPHVTAGITRETFTWAFTNTRTGNWHSLTWLSHMLDYELFGSDPSGHHLVNLFFHLANTLLLFLILQRMTGALWCSAFVAALFGLHPLRVESVAWASERKDVLSAFFWMLTMGAYLYYARRGGLLRYLGVLLAFCLGLLAKPMLVTLPLVLLLLDYWPLGRLKITRGVKPAPTSAGTASPTSESLARLIGEKIPLLVIAAAACVITFVVQQKAGAMETGEEISLQVRLVNALICYQEYMAKMLYPSKLAVFYPYPQKLSYVGPLLLLAIISFLALRWSREHPWLTVGWLWYLGTLVPVIGLVQVGSQSMADRYTYLPSIGFFIMIVWEIAKRTAGRAYLKPLLGIAAGAILAVLLFITRAQVKHWQNNITLFGHAARVIQNNTVMIYKYGAALFEDGQLDEAAEQFSRALEICPDYPKAHNGLGKVLLKRGKVKEALFHFDEALRVDANYPDFIYNRGLALLAANRTNEALVCFERALALATSQKNDSLAKLITKQLGRLRNP